MGACLFGCAGERSGTTSPSATTGTTTESETAGSPATTTAAETTTSVEAVEGPAHRHAFWSVEKLESWLVGGAILVEGQTVRLDGETLTCAGEGGGRARRGGRVWVHFSCIQPTFPPGQLVGPDALFRVHATGPATFLVTDARFSRY